MSTPSVLRDAEKTAERKWFNPQDAGDVLFVDGVVGAGQFITQYEIKANTASIEGFSVDSVVSGSGFGRIFVTATPSVTVLEKQMTKLQTQATSLEQEVKVLTQGVKKLDRRLREVIDEMRERPIITPAHLFDLGSADFYLSSPVPIVIEEYEQEVVARVPDLELHGIGNTEPEAVADLKSSFIELYLDLESTPTENMGKLPARWWVLLTKLVEKRGQA